MAWYYKEIDAVFIDVPKTASSFLRMKVFGCSPAGTAGPQVPGVLQFDHREIGVKHSNRLDKAILNTNKHKFCFIRHPFTWYLSYWGKKMRKKSFATRGKKHPTYYLDNCIFNKNLEKFFENLIIKGKMLDLPPYTQIVENYTGFISKTNEVDKVYLYENLHSELENLLKDRWSSFEESHMLLIKEIPPSHTSNEVWRQHLALINDDQIKYYKEKICELEYRVIEAYYSDRT